MSYRYCKYCNTFNESGHECGPYPTPAASGECPVCHYQLNAHHGWPCNTDYATAPPMPAQPKAPQEPVVSVPKELEHAPREWWITLHRNEFDAIVPLHAFGSRGKALEERAHQYVHVVEKSALDAAQAEIERLQKLHLQRTKDASVWLEERDALKAKCEQLEERLSAYQEKRLHAKRGGE